MDKNVRLSYVKMSGGFKVTATVSTEGATAAHTVWGYGTTKSNVSAARDEAIKYAEIALSGLLA